MPNIKFVDLCLLSQSERRALKVPLNAQRVVIQGGNGFGKSAIIKSLYETLGSTPQKIDKSWKTANVSSRLRFELDGVGFTAVKALGVHALFDANGRLLFMGQRLVKDWGPLLAKFFGFKLAMSDRDGEIVTPPPAYMFAPFYIDQDAGWSKAWTSFDDFYLPDTPRTLAEYHSGLKPDAYYEAKANLHSERLTLNDLDAGVRTLRETLTQVQAIDGESGPSYDLAEFNAEITDLVEESAVLLKAQASYRRDISELHEMAHLLRAEKALLQGALAEMRGEFDLATSLPDEVECPTCGQGYHNGLADRFALIADEGVLLDALGKTNIRLAQSLETEARDRGRLESVEASLSRIEQIVNTRRASLSLSDVLVAAGKTEAARILRTSLTEKSDALDAAQDRVDRYKATMEGLTSNRRSAEILARFRSWLSTYAAALDVRLEDADKQSISTIKTARGSEGPRALLAYYYAFLRTRQDTLPGIDFPLVIDAPNQQGQDASHLPQMLTFIFEHAPRNAQVIVATEDVGTVAIPGLDVRSYGERKRQVLRETEYEEVLALMTPFTDAILASTSNL